MSTLKVDTLNGSTGSTITVPSGQTLAVAGTLTTTGTFNPTADISVTGNISNDGVQIIDNTISASRTNDDLEISASGTGKVKIGVLKFPTSDGSSDQVLKTDGSGNLSFATLSSTSISQNNTNVTASDSGSNGTVTITCDGNTEMTVTDDGVRVHGNLTVDGTQTIINTSMQLSLKKIINFGTGKDYTINFLAKQIKKISKSKSKIVHITERKAEVQRLTCDAKLCKRLGWRHKVDIKTGLKLNIEWAKKNWI